MNNIILFLYKTTQNVTIILATIKSLLAFLKTNWNYTRHYRSFWLGIRSDHSLKSRSLLCIQTVIFRHPKD